ncbi:protease inhibitor I9 family protein [Streptacidiphilus jiangxiensis]|uniref:Inhibitor I9 domain-containing protein n=1 Tax=Streptacidiphilus jiangxiensis TaxID=235985 RepID=A0A1H7W9R9_STRJI|nr:protease inhibitor I9 family protein [Streptacidiphilus jiangxiensis]SEM18084.1 hypothetical protein SAMN05414137_12013 [Streptacidiphilus jiangxiensis]
MARSYTVVLNTTDVDAAKRLTDHVRAKGGAVTSRYDIGSIPAFAAELPPDVLAAVEADGDVDYVEANPPDRTG